MPVLLTDARELGRDVDATARKRAGRLSQQEALLAEAVARERRTAATIRLPPSSRRTTTAAAAGWTFRGRSVGLGLRRDMESGTIISRPAAGAARQGIRPHPAGKSGISRGGYMRTCLG